jgi:hypothetical protein
MKMLEREPGMRYLSDANDVGRLIEDCVSAGARTALLYADNLPGKFFDLSSGQAGVILQKLRTYKVRLAVVAPTERVIPTAPFREMLKEERRSGQFAVFDTRDAAAAWLVTGEHEVIRE